MNTTLHNCSVLYNYISCAYINISCISLLSKCRQICSKGGYYFIDQVFLAFICFPPKVFSKFIVNCVHIPGCLSVYLWYVYKCLLLLLIAISQLVYDNFDFNKIYICFSITSACVFSSKINMICLFFWHQEFMNQFKLGFYVCVCFCFFLQNLLLKKTQIILKQ